MATKYRRLLVVGVVALLAVFGGACARADREAAERKVEQSADKAVAETRELGNVAADAARTAGDKVEDAAKVAGHEVADALLVLKVKTALLDKLGIDGGRIDVDAQAGDVTLKGVVKTKSTANLAMDVARAVDGVAHVEQNILVEQDPAGVVIDKQVDKAIDKTQAEIADALLETRVKTGLIEAMGATAFDIEVEAQSGAVTLTGKVPDVVRRDLAVQTAAKTTGAARVVDQLAVAG
jgi:osmotically-inducible protein OsmY